MAEDPRPDASRQQDAPVSARRLAEQFAAHLRHLREFRGLAYVSAAPSPRRAPAVPAGAPPPEPAQRSPREPDRTWSSGQAPDPPLRAAPADPAGARARPWPEDQAGSARGAREEPARSRPPVGLPLADPRPPRPAEPAESPRPAEPAESPRPAGDGSLRAQAQTWTPAQKLAYLKTRNLGDCTRCKLAKTRTNIVFGVGDPSARLMFIGEAPGADEDRRGEPFVGAAGRRLTQWIERHGMRREQVYIANVLKCRPPGNREPAADEVEKCSPFLRAQIRAIRPDVIVALGRHAGMLLIGTGEDLKLAQMRSRRWTYVDDGAGLQIPLYVTYHPSYVIRREGELPPGQRNPADDTVMGDLERALRVLRAGS